MNNEVIKAVAKKLAYKPKSLAEISSATGYDTNAVKEAVQFLRMQGCAICSGGDGYWKWNGKDDSWEHTINRFKAQAKTLNATLNAMKSATRKGTVSLDDVVRNL